MVISFAKHLDVVAKQEEYGNYIQKCRAEMCKNPTGSEEKMFSILEDLGIAFEFQKIFAVKDKWIKLKIVDFYLSDYKLIVEVDGRYHSFKSKQFYKDKKRDKLLLKRPDVKAVVHITNKEIETLGTEKILKRIESY